MDPSPNLYISGLPVGIDKAALEGMFSTQGFTVYNCKILPDSKGVGLVSAMIGLSSVEEAGQAIECLNMQEIKLDNGGADSGMGGGMSASSAPSTLTVKYAGANQ